jgi:hypothetical protein
VIDSWRTRRFARILAVEHARSHILPPGGATQPLGDSAFTIYRL